MVHVHGVTELSYTSQNLFHLNNLWWAQYWFCFKKDLESSGYCCESWLLSIIQNVSDLILLSSISIPNIL